jgi:hypothetical protein
MSEIEIAVNDYCDATIIAEILMNNGYVVMMSREEDLYILNVIWSAGCNRNDVVFMDRGEFEEKYIEVTSND